jgi:hypothetical protein
MIILKEQGGVQTIKFIPRIYSADILVLRNETTNVSTTYNPTFTTDGYYLKCDLVLDLKENTFYNLTVLNSALPFTADNNTVKVDSDIFTADMSTFSDENSLVYRDKIFCTNQNKDDYTVNKNQYVANATTNEFKIYE